MPRLAVLAWGAALLLLAACGDSPGTSAPVSDLPDIRPSAAGYLTFEEGRATSGKRGLPLLLLVGTNRYRCPPAARLEDVLLKPPGSAVLEPLCVLARLDMDEPRQSGAQQAFRERYPAHTLPALYLIAPDGDLLAVIATGLYGCYREDAQPLPAFEGALLGAAEVAERVRSALAGDRTQRAWLATTAGSAEAGTVVERAAVLQRRVRGTEARAEALRAAGLPLSEVQTEALLPTLRALHEGEVAARLLRRLLAGTPTAAQRLRWTLELQRLEPEAKDLTGPSSLEGLRALAEAEGQPGVQALIVVEQLTRASAIGERGAAERHLAWLEEHLEALVGESREAPQVLDRLSGLAYGLGRVKFALRCVETLLARFPDSEEAQIPKHGILDQWRKEAATAKD